MRRMFGVLVLLGVVAFAAPAGAATITFGGGGSTGFNSNGEFASVGPVDLGGGLTLTVAPWASIGDSDEWRINSTNSGYGVDNHVCVVIVCDSDELDGFVLPDGLQFTFSAPVSLSQIVFGSWDSNDNAAAGDGSLFSSSPVDGTFSDNSGIWNFGPVVLTSFFVRAEDTGDDFRIRSLTYTASEQSPAPVPEPMSLLLVGSGLAGIGSRRFLRRRQS